VQFAAQLALIQSLKPTVLISMPSFALHLANLLAEQGVDLAQSSVKKLSVRPSRCRMPSGKKNSPARGAPKCSTFSG